MESLTDLPEFLLTPYMEGRTFDVRLSTVHELELMEANFQADVDSHSLGEASYIIVEDSDFFDGHTEYHLVNHSLKILRAALTLKRAANANIQAGMALF